MSVPRIAKFVLSNREAGSATEALVQNPYAKLAA